MSRTWASTTLTTDRAPYRRRPSQRGPTHEARPAPTPDPGAARRVRVGDGRPRERRPAGCDEPGIRRSAVGRVHARRDAVAGNVAGPDRPARSDAEAGRHADRSRDDHRPRVLLPRQLHGQPRARPGAPRGPEDAGRRNGRDDRAARRPERRRARRPAGHVHRDPGRDPVPRAAHRGRHRDGQPVARVRVGWGIARRCSAASPRSSTR